MDEVIKATNELKEYLLSLNEVQEYLRLKKAYEEDPSLKELKKLIVRAKNENRMDDYKILKAKFDEHPLVNNYLSSKEEVKNILKEVSEILN